MYFLRTANLAGLELPGVQDLAAQRHDGLELAVARLLGRTAGRVAFDQAPFRACQNLRAAVRELPGQRRAVDGALAHHARRRAYALLRVLDRKLCAALAGIRVLIKPQRRRVARV